MKKLVISVIALTLTAPAFASWPMSPIKREKLPFLEVDRAASVSLAAATWQQRLANMQRLLDKMHNYYEPASIPVSFMVSMSAQEEQLYLRRLLAVQKSVNENAALKGFTFVAPIPADLVQFSESNYATLHAFLQNNRTCQVTQVTAVYPFTLSVRVSGQGRSHLELWIDAAAKKVYLMSDNFYTTAAGKYALHLK